MNQHTRLKKLCGDIAFYLLAGSAALLILLPFFSMVTTSFKSMSEIQSPTFSLLPKEWHPENYVQAMASGDWGTYFYNTLLVTFWAVAISLVINSMAGYAFARLRFKGRDFLFLLTLVGMMVPVQVTMLPNFVLMRYIPLAGGNNLLGQGGTGLINTYTGILLPYIAGAFGVFLFRQFFMNFPASLDDAAKIDGLSRWGAFVRIYVPLSKPVFVTLIVLKTTSTWNEYTWPLIITLKKNMWTVQLALSVFKDEFRIQWNLLMAATTLIMIPLVVLYLFMQKYFVEGIVTTGMKG